MTDQFKNFIKVLAAFEKHEVDYIVIGGVAVIIHGMERLTRDLDIFVRVVPENIDQLRQALASCFDDPAIKEITLEELNQYQVIRYGTPDGFYIDIMANLGEVVVFTDLEYEVVDYHGINIKVATPETLFRLKQNTLRDKDKLDILFLKELIQARASALPGRK